MTDREKIKKGLECCKASTNDDPFQRCSECPYNDISISVQDCRAVLSADALELLKEQEPKKVIIDLYGNYCPWCSTKISRAMGAQKLHLGTKFCPFCGQKVKWG